MQSASKWSERYVDAWEGGPGVDSKSVTQPSAPQCLNILGNGSAMGQWAGQVAGQPNCPGHWLTADHMFSSLTDPAQVALGQNPSPDMTGSSATFTYIVVIHV